MRYGDDGDGDGDGDGGLLKYIVSSPLSIAFLAHVHLASDSARFHVTYHVH